MRELIDKLVWAFYRLDVMAKAMEDDQRSYEQRIFYAGEVIRLARVIKQLLLDLSGERIK